MKRVAIVVVLVIGAAVFGLLRSHGGARTSLNRVIGSSQDSQGQTREEIRKNFELLSGARVEVQGINGKVEIQTSETKAAEVYVLRTAKNSDALTRREVIIEQTATGLLIKGQQARRSGFWEHLFGSNPKEDVTIKAPRHIALALKGINGRVNTGDIDGAVEVKGINGRVELGEANESAEISGVNGSISVALKNLGERGARVSGVNGAIELRLSSELNADLTAKGMNGNVRSEIPDVSVDKDPYGSRYTARIGKGGAPITISGINGNVRLTRADQITAGKDKKESAGDSKSGNE
jgi:hypothetical protein